MAEAHFKNSPTTARKQLDNKQIDNKQRDNGINESSITRSDRPLVRCRQLPPEMVWWRRLNRSQLFRLCLLYTESSGRLEVHCHAQSSQRYEHRPIFLDCLGHGLEAGSKNIRSE